MNYSSGTLTLTLPLSYSSMSINSLTTATSFIYQGTELATTLSNYATTSQIDTAITTSNINVSNLITTSNLYCSNVAGIGTAINSTYSLSVNTLNIVNGLSLSGNRLYNIYQYLINNVVFVGTTGGSGSSSTQSGTLTLTMPNNYTASMSISNLITPTSFIYLGTE